MSEYHVVDIDIEDQECLVKALEELGYKPKICAEAQQLYGYQGDKRKQRAHVIIPRSQVGGSSNDIGFEKVKGKFIAHVSAYDKPRFKTKQDQLKQLYAKHRVLKTAKLNPSRFKQKSVGVDKEGNIRIKLQVRSL